jgi:hypothetical protein
MREWGPVLRFVRDNITLLVFMGVVGIMGAAWVIFEAIRSHKRRDEVYALQRRVAQLELEQAAVNPSSGDPVVLSSRWIRSGGAATTTDGGCLLLIDKVLPALRSAELTIRVDGYPILQNHPLRTGEHLEAAGKNGTYILQLYGVEGIQARLAIALRNHHRD